MVRILSPLWMACFLAAIALSIPAQAVPVCASGTPVTTLHGGYNGLECELGLVAYDFDHIFVIAYSYPQAGPPVPTEAFYNFSSSAIQSNTYYDDFGPSARQTTYLETFYQLFSIEDINLNSAFDCHQRPLSRV